MSAFSITWRRCRHPHRLKAVAAAATGVDSAVAGSSGDTAGALNGLFPGAAWGIREEAVPCVANAGVASQPFDEQRPLPQPEPEKQRWSSRVAQESTQCYTCREVVCETSVGCGYQFPNPWQIPRLRNGRVRLPPAIPTPGKGRVKQAHTKAVT